MLFLLPFLAACTATSGDKGAAGTLDAPTLRLSDGIETVVVAEWSAVDGADETWIEFGTDTGYGTEAPERATGEAILLGNRADTEVHARLAALVGDEVQYSDDVSIVTGSLPSGLLAYSATSDSGAGFGDWFLTSFSSMGGMGGGGGGGSSGGGTAVVMFDRTGAVVWYTEPMSGVILAAKPARDGEAILYLWGDGPSDTPGAEICRVDLSGEDTTCVDTPSATHDFWEMPDGSYTYGKSIDIEWNGYTIVGDDLVNQTLDGEQTTIWSSYPEITPEVAATWSDRSGVRNDWTHFNGIWYDEPSDAYYVSFLLLQEVRKIGASTGETQWVLGGDENEFEVDGELFGPQHAPQLIDGGLLVFDNNATSQPSALAAYDLDESGLRAEATVRIEHPDRGHAVAMGDAHLLPNGYYAAAFGDAGDLYVFSADGDVEWSMSPDAGVLPGQVYVFDSLYGIEMN